MQDKNYIIWLKNFRKVQGLSIKRLAEIIGVSNVYMSNICYGQRKPSANFIAKWKKKYPQTDTNIFFD
jgi:transcriptional regulator with XRE-family HTH domain